MDDRSPMALPDAVQALSALAHNHRLAAFRLLVKAGAQGVPAGQIAREIGIVPSTLSTHLAILAQAGLIHARREGRSVIYAADFPGMQALMGFLLSDCCAGQPEICASLIDLVQATDRCSLR